MAEFDLTIIGGGPAGASAAIGLAQQGLKVALIDRRRPAGLAADGRMDTRVVAISPGSMAWLQQIGAAGALDTARMAPYTAMHVSSGRQRIAFNATEHGLDQLGWIVEIANLNDALWRTLERHESIEPILSVVIEHLDLNNEQTRIVLDDDRSLRAPILIGADGARSRVRSAAGIEHTIDDYNQRAIVAPLKSRLPNTGIAWQRFTQSGPLALLPLPNQGSSLVWSVPVDLAETLLKLSDDAFLERLNQAAQDHPFGELNAVGLRHALPLVRRQSKQFNAGRSVLIGDAARSVHPLAGQGMNLGLADAAELTQTLQGWERTRHPRARLARYARRRLSDSTLIAGGIHIINESRSFGPVLSQLGMSTAFKVLSSSRWARDPFVRRACGLN
ncbi:MAG: FAD-dependent oxidoreductase [Pseudomonadota bacterium]